MSPICAHSHLILLMLWAVRRWLMPCASTHGASPHAAVAPAQVARGALPRGHRAVSRADGFRCT